MGQPRELRPIRSCLCLLGLTFCLALSRLAVASEFDGQVTFDGLPVPGALVTAMHGGKKLTAITDEQGFYSFPDLADGPWAVAVEMTGFATGKQEVTVAPHAPALKWELKLLPLEQMKAAIAKPLPPVNSVAPELKHQASGASGNAPSPVSEAERERAQEGLLINGSVNNAASSPYALAQAFGNNRNGGIGLYNGSIGMKLDNSALDARAYSVTGLNLPKPYYNNLTGVATFGGPLKIPHLLRNGPTVFLAYQWTRDSSTSTQPATVPTLAERNGDLSQILNAAGQPVEIFDPVTGLPLANNLVPVSPQAQALLNLYPLPNSIGASAYNYEIPLVSNTHVDAMQAHVLESVNSKNHIYGIFAFANTRMSSPNVFGFLDKTAVLGINAKVSWTHRINSTLFTTPGYSFSRLRTRLTPYFENRENVSGNAGITGNDQDPTYWGPPTLSFSSDIAQLTDANSEFNRNETNGISDEMLWSRNRHNFEFGGDFRRQEFNYLAQQNPRGTFTFTGAATQGTVNGVATGGSDFADFLLGIPDTSTIAYGNADKYFRESVYDAYFTDDWRIRPELTINAGIRWEYGAPITELFGRLVNLDITPGFSAAAPVVANDPIGPLTLTKYPDSLVRPDKRGFEPRVGIAWRPIAGSSLVVRAGYGLYEDTSVYQTIANQMAQQAPLSKSLSVENSAACPLTLANGFLPCSSTTQTTFAVDPSFRVGYAQDWQLALQRDLPGSLQVTATYLGIKGTRGQQEFLPNTYPIGAVNPCPGCPIGFTYLASNGNSTRQSGNIQLRRRLHDGFTATLEYTYSKSIDDDSSLGGQGYVSPQSTSGSSGSGSGSGAQSSYGSGSSSPSTSSTSTTAPTASAAVIAQNWLDLKAERGLSTFDQRNLLSVTLQYTTGMGIGGGTLLDGWKGALLKEWTFYSQITAGSGLPETPIYPAAVPGTGFTDTIRPNYTGAPIRSAAPGYFLNAAAYTPPTPGQWGSAGRDSIIGPDEFTLNASAARTFRLKGKYSLDLRVDSTNLLNHVTYSSWNAITTSPQFGLPVAGNAMRSLETTLRVRF